MSTMVLALFGFNYGLIDVIRSCREVINQGGDIMRSRTMLVLAVGAILAVAVCSCSKKEPEVQPAEDQATTTPSPKTYTDEEIVKPLPEKGTPEHDALKKQMLEEHMAAVQQHKSGEGDSSAVAAEVGQEIGTDITPQPSGAEPGVTPGTSGGGVRRATVKSDFPCRSKTDCISTKFANAPTKKDDCTCQAACTPFVVNNAEKQRRESANKSLCTNKDWFGDACPAPSCGFIEFDSFACIDGKCVGYALGE